MRTSIKAKRVKAGMVLDFSPTETLYPENLYRVVTMREIANGYVDIVFHDTNDGQPYRFQNEEMLFLIQ